MNGCLAVAMKLQKRGADRCLVGCSVLGGRMPPCLLHLNLGGGLLAFQPRGALLTLSANHHGGEDGTKPRCALRCTTG